ncbi:MAG: hypothetical protein ACI9VR_001682 [Cognaticolwellia sp.]|jgi:hypothetical protein
MPTQSLAPGAASRSLLLTLGALILGCTGGEPCVEDTAALAGVLSPLSFSGSFDGGAYDGDCIATTCPVDSGRATVRCDPDGTIVLRGELPDLNESLDAPRTMDITLHLAPALSAGEHSFVGDDGLGYLDVNRFDSVNDSPTSASVDLEVFEPGQQAIGSFEGRWEGDFDISVQGTFALDCEFADL